MSLPPPSPLGRRPRSHGLFGWLAGVAFLGACGGASEGEPAPASTPETGVRDVSAESEETAPRRSFDVDVELRGERRTLSGHRTQIGEWADPLRERIDPEREGSATERVAVRVERGLEELVRALFAGDREAARARLAEDFAGFTGLFAHAEEPRFDDGSFVVRDASTAEADKEDLESLLARLEELDAPEVAASVIGVQDLGGGLWECDVELRVVAPGAVPVMIDTRATTRQREAGDGVPPLLVALEVATSRRVERSASTFQSITGPVLEPLPFWERELALGCEDYDQWADRRRISFGTGMLGMALGDVNGDGLEDVYLSAISGFPNRLLLHQPDGSVVDGAPEAAVDVLDTTRGCLLADLDGDGDLDLAVARQADLLLFWNDGTGDFEVGGYLAGPSPAPIYSISAADPDLDGDLDLYCSRYLTGSTEEAIPVPYHNATNGAVNLYWRNEGGREFTSAGEETGLTAGEPRYSFIALWDDFDGDGRIDLYVVNDFGPNNLYIQTDDGYVDRAEELGMLDAATGMGISGADVELDGDLDYFVTNMFSAPGLRSIGDPMYRGGEDGLRPRHMELANGMSLLLREGDRYVESAEAAGVHHGGWAWGALFYDWNLDGYPDLYVPNGFMTAESSVDLETLFWRGVVGTTPDQGPGDEEYNRNWTAVTTFNRMEGYSNHGNEPNIANLNLGDGSFADVSPISDVDFPDDGRVAARVDWDGDGLEDLILVNRTGPRMRLVRNAHPAPGHRVVIDLQGRLGTIDAIGARVAVERSDGKVVTQTIYAGEGLLGQSSHRRFFGLGEADGAVDVQVTWPDGEVQRFEDLAPDRGWRLEREGGERSEWSFAASPFAESPHSPARPRSGGVERLVLAETMPLRSYVLQGADGRKVGMDGLLPGAKLLVFWDPATRSGLSFLRDLAAVHGEVLGLGGLVCPVALEGEAIDTGAVLDELGLAELALAASRNDEMILEALLFEILADYDDIPLPISLLLDPRSELCAIYFGEPAVELVLDDLRRLEGLGAGADSSRALSGGHWIARPGRGYRQTNRVLMGLGARDLANDFKERRRSRQ